MSLSQEPAFSTLKKHFVVGWKNNQREDYVGTSHGYTCEQAAVGTTNGAGPRNMQTFVLSPDGVVLHCLPGFWHPEDLAHELEMSRTLYRLWKDKRSVKQKKEMFTRIQMMSIRRQPRALVQRSGWQGFDKLNESNRIKMGAKRDTFVYDQNGKPTRIKPTSTLVHERMAKRPFVRFSRFDTAVFADYGRPYYDNNMRVDGAGVNFGGSTGALESQKRMADRKKVREAKKRKVDAYYGKKPKVAKGKKKSKKSRTGAAINTMCPVTGKPVRAGKVSKVDGQAIGLCCNSCKKKFEKNPAKFLGNVKEFKKSRKSSAMKPQSKRKQQKERPTSRPTSRPTRRRDR